MADRAGFRHRRIPLHHSVVRRPAVTRRDGWRGFLPDGVPSNWTIFFGAEDVDKTLRVIADNGGAVVRGAEDTPYGRLAAATDPTGVIFNLSSLQS